MADEPEQSTSKRGQNQFPGCVHFRRWTDGHFKCRRCRIEEGLGVCTRDNTCDACREWDEAEWRKEDKAIAAAAQRASRSRSRDVEEDVIILRRSLIVVKCM